MKSATTTLYEQLNAQRGIFMPALKEPNFFSDDTNYARGHEWYLSLFRSASPNELIGEASTHYTKLPTYPDTIKRMKSMLPAPRLIYIMRHPIDRLVSQYIHQWSQNEIRLPLERAVEAHSELINYSRYGYQLLPYFEAYGQDTVLPVILERLAIDPIGEFAKVCRFIGYDQTPTWNSELSTRNRSSGRTRQIPLHDKIIVSRIASRIRRSIVPKAVRCAIRKRLSLQERPELSPKIRARLIRLFDCDLEALSDRLGQRYDCATFETIKAGLA